MPKFSGAEKGSGRLMPMAKKQNHAKQGVVGPKGILAQKSVGLQAPFGSLKSEDAKRIPSMLPPKPPKLAV